MAEMSSLEIPSMIQGYHEYQRIWSAAVGEELPCSREFGNVHDLFAVAVKRSGSVVGHVPKRISSICSSFLRRNGTITCRVTGTRRYSADLAQGGLEIPCRLIFRGKKSELNKIEKLMEVAVKIDKPDTKSSKSTKATSLTNSPGQFKQSTVNITTSENPSVQIIKSPNMSVKVTESSNPSVKITTSSNPSIEIANSSNPSIEIADSSDLSVDIMKCVNPSINVADSFTKTPVASNTSINNDNPPDNGFSHSSTIKMCECIDLTHILDPLPTTHVNSKFMPNDNELGRIVRGEQLTDLSINCAQRMLKRQFPTLNGLNSTLLQQKNCKIYLPDCLQIIHSRQSHWVVATTVRCNNNEVILYDSMYEEIDENTANVIYNLFNTRTVKIAKCQQQEGAVDCGLFSIAFATSIAHGFDPTTVEYIQAHMRIHLVKCFSQGTLTLFPCK